MRAVVSNPAGVVELEHIRPQLPHEVAGGGERRHELDHPQPVPGLHGSGGQHRAQPVEYQAVDHPGVGQFLQTQAQHGCGVQVEQEYHLQQCQVQKHGDRPLGYVLSGRPAA